MYFNGILCKLFEPTFVRCRHTETVAGKNTRQQTPPCIFFSLLHKYVYMMIESCAYSGATVVQPSSMRNELSSNELMHYFNAEP